MKIIIALLLTIKWFLVCVGFIFICMLFCEYLNQDEEYQYHSTVHEYRNEELNGASAPEYTPRGPPGVVNGAYINPRPNVQCNHRQYPKRTKCRKNDSRI
jgi:hypothetical protein